MTDGDPEFTPTELRILQLMADGRTNAEIGTTVGYSKNTIGHHQGGGPMRRIYVKLDVVRFPPSVRRTVAVAEALRRGVIR